MTTYRILDLDNCISDDGWRIPFINWQKDRQNRYHEYHQLAPFDKLGNKGLLTSPHKLIVFTGRPVYFHAATEHWLQQHFITITHLIMRNNDDLSNSADLKQKQLSWLLGHYLSSHDTIADAFDDRPDVVAMYRAHGIDAHVRAIHNVDAYSSPCGKVQAA